MTKEKKFQKKWIFDENLAYCAETGIWCLIYINGKRMFCNLCRLANTMHSTNASKVWNWEPNIRYRAETIKDHFKNDTFKQTMHKDAVTTELAEYDSYFVEKERKKNYYKQVTKKSSLLYTGFVNKRFHIKLNSLLEMLESLGIEEVKQFKRCSSTV